MLKSLTLLEILFVAAFMDVQRGKISNRLIVMGAGFGMLFQIQENGVMGVYLFLRNFSFPVIMFYLLFLMRVLGAGDIKLLSVIGSMLDVQGLYRCVLYAFFWGAAWALIRLMKKGLLFEKMREFLEYLQTIARTGKAAAYCRGQRRQEVICFSIPILCGYLCYLLEVMC